MSLKERIDAQRAGYDSPLQLVPEGQAFPGAAEAGRVSRDFATPLRLNAALTLKIWSEIYLPGVLMALVWIVLARERERGREREREREECLLLSDGAG